MKLYGSIFNRMQERTNVTPKVGMGATEMFYTDREPYEIIEVIDARHIVVRELDAKRTDHNGMSECQDYEYTSNMNNPKIRLFFTKQGKWRERYPNGRLGCNAFAIGFAEKYHDYSF